MKNPVYLTNDEIVSLVNSLVSEALTESNHPWHPEDAYLQVEGAIRHGFTALGYLAQMRHSN